MIDKQTIEYLKLVHGTYNTLVMLLFFYHASLGFRIRRQRKSGGQFPASAVRIHRRQGPVLLGLGILGFFAGLGLTLIDKGHALHHPLHFFVGLSAVAVLITTYTISRRITAREVRLRNTHWHLGLLLLALYGLQFLIGLGILL